MGRSVAWFPLVGAIIGGLLVIVSQLVSSVFDGWISAALVLTAWVLLTGALHLDGLADSADAWLGGLGSKSRTLKIMKDPTSGPIAISVLILVLMLKLACLHALFNAEASPALIWALIFARCNAVLLLMKTPYARDEGLTASLQAHLSPKVCHGVIAGLAFISCWYLGWTVFIVLLIAASSLYLLRKAMMKRLEGCTGDTLGALIELSETAVLLTLVACLTNP